MTTPGRQFAPSPLYSNTYLNEMVGQALKFVVVRLLCRQHLMIPQEGTGGVRGGVGIHVKKEREYGTGTCKGAVQGLAAAAGS